MSISNPAGVHNALKMREMFMDYYEGYRCRLDIDIDFVRHTIGKRWPLVAILSVHDAHGLYSAHFYFKEDGTYYRGTN